MGDKYVKSEKNMFIFRQIQSNWGQILLYWGKKTVRVPADREVSIKKFGFTRQALGRTVLWHILWCWTFSKFLSASFL